MEKGVTDAAQQCLGLPQYCSEEIAELIESLDSYIKRDYTALIKKLEWLFDTKRRKTEFHRGDLEDLINSWRKKEITDLEKFSLYQREYTAVAAPLKAAGHLTEKDFNIGLWAGLHEGTRDRLERRIMTKNTQRDIKNPFEEAEIEEAAAHIFDRDRFDKHLREGQKSHRRIFEDRTSKRKRNHKRRQQDSDSDSDSDSEKNSESETEQEEVPRWAKSKTSRKAKAVPVVKPEPPKKKTDKEEISELVSKLEGMSIRDTTYRPTYVHLSMLAPHIAELYEKPEVRIVRSYQTQGPMANTNPGAWRDQPPHSTMPPRDQRFTERREPTCYGCGERGHRMDQCSKIEAFITQGHVRRIDGRLRWADGSSISREPDESWTKAILRRIQHENEDTATRDNGRSKGVYYVEIARDDSDADTDIQAEIGWMSGAAKVDHLQSYSVERPSRVSKDHRKGAQTNIPPGPHRMKEFPRGNREGPDRKKHSVAFDAGQDDRQNRLQRIPAPTTRHVSPIVLKRELNIDAIPMDVDKPSPTKVLDDVGKTTTRGKEGTPRDVSQGRTKRHRIEQEVVDELMKVPVTLSFQKIAHISPRVRRDLAGALRAIKDNNMDDNEDEHLNETKKPSMDPGKQVKSMRAERIIEEFSEDLLDNLDLREARAELLKLEATVGEAVMKGIVDTGSMVSMISADMAEASGLPCVPLKRRPFKVIGVNGVTSVCRSKIPGAKIYLTSEKHETEGDLYVLDKADFDLLLGRPWGTYNGVGIEERVRGTYVSYITDTKRFEVNASKAHSIPVQIGEVEAGFCYRRQSDTSESDDDEEVNRVLTARVIREGTDRSYVPDSEESRLGPEYVKEEANSEEDRFEVERANRRVKERIAEWQREQDEEADDEKEEGREKEGREWTPPPNQLDKGKRKASRVESDSDESAEQPRKMRKKERGGIIEVDEDMEEEYITMTHDDVDEEEWDKFYAREGKRLSKNNEQWTKWLEDNEEEDQVSEVIDDEGLRTPVSPRGSSIAEEPPALSPEPSNTLRTAFKRPAERVKATPGLKTRVVTAERAVRRSHRLRQSTRCTLCNEDLVPRVRKYERTYKISREKNKRTHITSNNEPSSEDPADAPALSLCTRIVWTNTEEEESGIEMGNVESKGRRRRRMRIGYVGESTHPPSATEHEDSDSEDGLPFPDDLYEWRRYQGIRPPSPPPRIIGRVRDIVKYRAARERIPQDGYDRGDGETDLHKSIADMISEHRVEVQQELTRKYREKRRALQPDSEGDPHQSEQKEEGRTSEGGRGYETAVAEEDKWQGGEKTRQPAWPHAGKDHDNDPNNLGPDPRKGNAKGGAVKRIDVPPTISPSAQIIKEWMKRTDLPKEPHEVQPNEETLPITDNRMGKIDRSMEGNVDESRMVESEGTPKEAAEDARNNGGGGLCTKPTPEETCKQEGVSSGDNDENIKPPGRRRSHTHLPVWLQKRLRSTKFLKATCKVLASLLILLFILLIRSTFRTHKETTHLAMTYQTTDRHEESSSDSSQPQGRPYALSEGRTLRANGQAHPTDNEVAEAVLETISTPQDDQYTPGIVAIKHLVPLAVTSSRRVREYLGKAGTLTFHSTSGRRVTVRGDVHLRIVEQGIANGWGGVDCPSPAEVHHVQDILFSDPKQGGEMDQPNKIYAGARHGQQEPFTRELIPIEDMASNERAPPNTPDEAVKIGPPGLRRSGRRKPTAMTSSADSGSPARNSKHSKSPSEEDFVVVTGLENATAEGQRKGRKSQNGRNVPFRSEAEGQAGAVFVQPGNAATDASSPPELVYPNRESYERTKPRLETEDQVMDQEDAEEIPDTPKSSDTAAEEDNQGKGNGRDPEDTYAEIIDVLRKIRLDLAVAVDIEAQRLIDEAERDAYHLLRLKGMKGEGGRDGDGDIEMGKGEREEGRDVAPAYHPVLPVSEMSENSPYVPKSPTELRIEDLEDRMQRIEGEVREVQWKAAGFEYNQNDMILFESRLAAMEVRKAEEAEGWKIAQPNRRKPRAPVTRGNRNRGGMTEGKVDAVREEVFGIQMRIGNIEEALKGVEKWQVQVSAMDLKMEGRVAEAALWVKKVGELENKWDELRLRQDVISRDIGQGKAVVNLALSPRVNRIEAAVTKFETWMKGAEFRFGTNEEQASWLDQKVRGVYHLAIQETSAERFLFATTVRTIWDTAAKSYEERMRHAPPKVSESSVDPRAQQDGNVPPSKSVPVLTHVPKLDGLPSPNSKPPASY